MRMRQMKAFILLLILLLAGCAAETSPAIVISKQYDVCTNVGSARFELHEGLDALSGRVSQGRESVSLYIGRHPRMYGENLSVATSGHPSLKKRLEIKNKDRYVILYSYADEVSGFNY